MSQSAVRSGPGQHDLALPKHQNIKLNAVNTPIVADVHAENERLNRMHHWQTQAVSGLCWPMDDVRSVLAPQEGTLVRVLSVSSGSGIWAAEMAKEFPHAEVLGVDGNPQQPSDTPSNCRFEALDLENGDISHLQGMFNVVHCARSGGRILYCKPFWARLVQLLKPGGLLLFIGCGTDTYDESKNPRKLAEVGQEPGTGSWWARFWAENYKYSGIWLDIERTKFNDSVLDWLQRDPDLEDAKVTRVYLPLGWPGSDEDKLANKEEIGRQIGISAIERGRYIGPTLVANGMPVDLLSLLMREYEAEILGQQCKSYILWPFFAARKRAL